MNKIYLKCGKHMMTFYYVSALFQLLPLLVLLLLLRFVFFYRYCFVFTYYVSVRCTRIFLCIEFFWKRLSVCPTMRLHMYFAFCSRARAERGTYVWYVHLNLHSMHFYFLCHSCVGFEPTVCARLFHVSFFVRPLFVSSLKMNVPVDFIGSPDSHTHKHSHEHTAYHV